MTEIHSVSGGLASAANAILAARAGVPFIMVFADTTIEDDDLHRFLYDLETYLKHPIIRLKDGRDPWQVFEDVGYIGNSQKAHCSKMLKTQMVAKFANMVCRPDDPMILGMYRDESERLDRAAVNWAPRPVRSRLIEQSIYPSDVEQIVCVEAGIKKPRLYDMGFPHNNCGGMCVRAGQGQFARLLDLRPATYAKNEQRNEQVRKTIAKRAAERIAAGTYKGKTGGESSGGFIRVKRNGVTEYLHMKEFRERVQSGELIPARYEMGGCGCFVDDEL